MSTLPDIDQDIFHGFPDSDPVRRYLVEELGYPSAVPCRKVPSGFGEHKRLKRALIPASL